MARRSRLWQTTRPQWPCCGKPLTVRERDISAARAYRYKYGFGLNWEQEMAKNVGLFSRLGWNDGHEEAWTFTDANWSASLGVSVKGQAGAGPTTPSALPAS